MIEIKHVHEIRSKRRCHPSSRLYRVGLSSELVRLASCGVVLTPYAPTLDEKSLPYLVDSSVVCVNLAVNLQIGKVSNSETD